MKTDATEQQIQDVVQEIEKSGLRADVSRGEFRTVIGMVGDESMVPIARIAAMPGVKEAATVEAPYKLINREYNSRLEGVDESRVIRVGGLEIGGAEPVFIVGPCAVESREQLLRIA
ncbi:MAG: hypothetical protein ABH839_04620 [Chloroflexota bacterium]